MKMTVKFSLVKITNEKTGRPITLISEKSFIYFYKTMGYRSPQFKEKFGVSYKLYRASLHAYFTQEEIKKEHGLAISKSQSLNNSNLKNKGIPRKILDKKLIEEYLLKCYSVEAIAKEFNVAPQTVFNNIEYHEIDFTEFEYTKFISMDTFILLNQLDNAFGTSLLELHKSSRDENIQEIFDQCLIASNKLREFQSLVSKVRKNTSNYAKTHKIKYEYKQPARSLVNYNFGKAFTELGCEIRHEFLLDNKFFDIWLVGTKYLIEIDSDHWHNKLEAAKKNDIVKTALAKKHGYRIVRLKTHKDKYPAIFKKVEECLQKIK